MAPTQVFGLLESDTVSMCPRPVSKCRISIYICYIFGNGYDAHLEMLMLYREWSLHDEWKGSVLPPCT